ncbi:unnamed protein product, partial [Arabidopsis halleri]
QRSLDEAIEIVFLKTEYGREDCIILRALLSFITRFLHSARSIELIVAANCGIFVGFGVTPF